MNPLNDISIKKLNLFLSLFFLALFFAIPVQAQEENDTTTLWQIETKDGNIYTGTILESDANEIHLHTKSLGTLVLKKKDIKFKQVYESSRIVDGELVPMDRLASRNMLSPTGILQKARQGYYENKYLFVNHLNIAFSDGFSLGMGMVPLFFLDATASPIWIVPKIRIKTRNKRLNISTGLFYSRFIFDDYGESDTWIAYGMGTYGNDNMSFTAGIGFGFFDYDWLQSPVFSFSGKVKLSRRSYLFVESILINTFNVDNYYGGWDNLSVAGARTAWRGIVLDYGVLVPTGSDVGNGRDDIIVVPYLGLVIPFGTH